MIQQRILYEVTAEEYLEPIQTSIMIKYFYKKAS